MIDPIALAKAPLDPRWTGAGRVRLLDRIVEEVRPDGSALSLHHQLVRLSTKDAADIAGEIRLPDGAIPLSLRTLKPDGRAIEVDRHAGKEDLSFSALAPGDTVEQAPELGGPSGHSRELPVGRIDDAVHDEQPDTSEGPVWRDDQGASERPDEPCHPRNGVGREA